MSQCVPNWDLDESRDTPRLPFHADANSHPTLQDATMLDYEVAELTWENGHLAMHGLGLPRAAAAASAGKSLNGKYPWEKPQAGGTLESIVNQAAGLPPVKIAVADDELFPWFDQQRTTAAAANMARDALVPCSNPSLSVDEQSTRVPGSRLLVSSTRVGSCSTRREEEAGCGVRRKRSRAAQEGGSSMNQTVSRSESRQVTGETGDLDPTSQENTSFGEPLSSYSKQTADDHDAFSRSRTQRGEGGSKAEKKATTKRSSASTKRSRAAAIHNQSERKRRDRINQRMKTLQKLVPNSSKTDKASMLDEVIEYLKQLQAQIQMMSKMSSFPHMMLPLAMQQMQMAMMTQMGIGMSMGMGVMDMNTMSPMPRPGQSAGLTPALHPSAAAAFLPLAAAWDTSSSDRLAPPAAAAAVMPDPMAAFLACSPTQPMTLDAYNRMAALYQHLYQQTGPPCSKS